MPEVQDAEAWGKLTTGAWCWSANQGQPSARTMADVTRTVDGVPVGGYNLKMPGLSVRAGC